MLKWIKVHYPEIPILLIIRHPLSTVLSKTKLSWDTRLEDLLEQDELMHDYLSQYKDIFKKYTSEFDKHLILWCIENLIPLKQFADNEIKVVFYAHLFFEPEKTIRSIASYLNWSYDQRMVNAVQVPSGTDWNKSRIKQNTSFEDNFSKSDLKNYFDIMSAFDLLKLYELDIMPKVEINQNVLDLYSI